LRIGHAALEALLLLNGYELTASVDIAESEILAVAAGERTREQLESWISEHMGPTEEHGAT